MGDDDAGGAARASAGGSQGVGGGAAQPQATTTNSSGASSSSATWKKDVAVYAVAVAVVLMFFQVIVFPAEEEVETALQASTSASPDVVGNVAAAGRSGAPESVSAAFYLALSLCVSGWLYSFVISCLDPSKALCNPPGLLTLFTWLNDELPRHKANFRACFAGDETPLPRRLRDIYEVRVALRRRTFGKPVRGCVEKCLFDPLDTQAGMDNDAVWFDVTLVVSSSGKSRKAVLASAGGGDSFDLVCSAELARNNRQLARLAETCSAPDDRSLLRAKKAGARLGAENFGSNTGAALAQPSPDLVQLAIDSTRGATRSPTSRELFTKHELRFLRSSEKLRSSPRADQFILSVIERLRALHARSPDGGEVADFLGFSVVSANPVVSKAASAFDQGRPNAALQSFAFDPNFVGLCLLASATWSAAYWYGQVAARDLHTEPNLLLAGLLSMATLESVSRAQRRERLKNDESKPRLGIGLLTAALLLALSGVANTIFFVYVFLLRFQLDSLRNYVRMFFPIFWLGSNQPSCWRTFLSIVSGFATIPVTIVCHVGLWICASSAASKRGEVPSW